MDNNKFGHDIDNCIVCNSRKINKRLIDYRGIRIDICGDCGFQFMNPPYSDGYLTEYYSTYTTRDDYEKWRLPLLYGHDFYLSQAEKYQSNVGVLLDIGCGNGFLLEAAQKRGWEIIGYDVDVSSCNNVSKRLNASIYTGNFFDIPIQNNHFDLITMHQVLEHLKDPKTYLKKVHLLLKDSGYLFIAVPNIKSFSNNLKFYFEKAGLRRKRIGAYYETEHHLNYFTPVTLKILLESTGFEVVYERNCHAVRPGQSMVNRFLKRHVTEYFFATSAFFMIAKKKA